jgi:hypothetical protein
VVYYSITVSTNDLAKTKSWILNKQFSNFEELHNNLSKVFTNVPARPKKTIFKMTDPKEINQPRKELEAFSNKLIESTELFDSPLLRSFFNIGLHAPEYSTKQRLAESLVSTKVITNPVSKLLFNTDINMIITVEKVANQDKLKHVNLLKLFVFKYPYGPCELKWNIQLSSKITCIEYYTLKNIFAFGTELGMLHIHSLLKHDELDSSRFPIPAHTDEITTICFEENELCVISVGADKRVVGTSLDGKLLYSSKIGEHCLTSVHFNTKNTTIAITNTNGKLFICDVKSVKAVLLQKIVFTD